MHSAAYSIYVRLPERLQSAVRTFVVKATVFSDFGPSFSRGGEDMVLRKLFERRPPGFYVDVGAFHPWKASNTYGLYLRGWRGINVDASPGSMALFDRVRPRDINVETAVGSQEGSAEYYLFADSALNRLHSTSLGGHAAIRQESVQVRRLDSILAAHLPPATTVDLLCVDVEGADLDVLQSNDWDRYRAGVVVVEEDDGRPSDYLRSLGYHLVAEVPVVLGSNHNSFFVDGSPEEQKPGQGRLD